MKSAIHHILPPAPGVPIVHGLSFKIKRAGQWWRWPLVPAIGRLRQADPYGLHFASSRSAKVTQRNPVSGKNKEKPAKAVHFIQIRHKHNLRRLSEQCLDNLLTSIKRRRWEGGILDLISIIWRQQINEIFTCFYSWPTPLFRKEVMNMLKILKKIKLRLQLAGFLVL